MIWEDILITRSVSEREIATAMAAVFNIDQNRVMAIPGIPDYDGEVPDEIGILCEHRPVTGDFVLHLSIYLRDDALERYAEAHEIGILVGQLCQIWSSAALMSDDSIDPYSWLLVRGPDDIQSVQIDSEILDDDDAWVLASVPEAAGAHPSMD
ncbi:MAG TPA: hypothetical protein VEX37_13520 [Thermomicrobiales bacterium]|nr:hypothetical protein [Thermomicrobiales bacterium]